MSGWWFGTWILFAHSVGNFIIPTDFHSIIFQRGRLNHQPDHHQYSTIPTNINHWTSLNHIWYHGIFNRSSNHPSSSDIMVKWIEMAELYLHPSSPFFSTRILRLVRVVRAIRPLYMLAIGGIHWDSLGWWWDLMGWAAMILMGIIKLI